MDAPVPYALEAPILPVSLDACAAPTERAADVRAATAISLLWAIHGDLSVADPPSSSFFTVSFGAYRTVLEGSSGSHDGPSSVGCTRSHLVRSVRSGVSRVRQCVVVFLSLRRRPTHKPLVAPHALTVCSPAGKGAGAPPEPYGVARCHSCNFAVVENILILHLVVTWNAPTPYACNIKLYSQSSGCGCRPAREAFSFILAPKPMLRAQPLARRRAPLGSRGAPVVAGRGGRRDHLLHHGTLCRVVHFHPQESTHERSCVELPHACRERDVSRCSAQIPGGNSQRHQHTHVPYPPPAAGTASLSLSMKLRSGSEASHLSTPSGPFGGEE